MAVVMTDTSRANNREVIDKEKIMTWPSLVPLSILQVLEYSRRTYPETPRIFGVWWVVTSILGWSLGGTHDM